MIRIEKRRLKFLLAGRVLAVELPREPVRPYSRSRTYAVALPGKRSATCRVQVLEADGLSLKIRHAPGAEDKPRMLARGFGYTELGDPLDAGECPRPEELERYSDESRQRHDESKRSDRGSLPLADRLRDLERRAIAGDQQARRHLFVIRQRLEVAERRQSRPVLSAVQPILARELVPGPVPGRGPMGRRLFTP